MCMPCARPVTAQRRVLFIEACSQALGAFGPLLGPMTWYSACSKEVVQPRSTAGRKAAVPCVSMGLTTHLKLNDFQARVWAWRCSEAWLGHKTSFLHGVAFIHSTFVQTDDMYMFIYGSYQKRYIRECSKQLEGLMVC